MKILCPQWDSTQYTPTYLILIFSYQYSFPPSSKLAFLFSHLCFYLSSFFAENEGEDSDAGGEGQLVFASYGFPLAASSLPERSFTLRLDYDTLSITDSSEQ